jgi:hypothetical protein
MVNAAQYSSNGNITDVQLLGIANDGVATQAGTWAVPTATNVKEEEEIKKVSGATVHTNVSSTNCDRVCS